MNNILVCDDEKDIVAAIKIYLEAEGYNVLCAYDGNEALNIIENNEIHLLISDIMMPECDGITALSRLREFSNIPAILLTAKGEDTDKVLGLNVGADDYITKPFNTVELIARVRSHLRRYIKLGGKEQKESGFLSVGNIELDDDSKSVLLDGENANLTRTEFEILKFLMENKNKVLSPKQIYEAVWNEPGFASEGTVAVHIRHIREKIEINPAEPRYLKVVWGRGYKIEEN